MILITGASGFAGSHLCKRLVNDGNKVIGLVHKNVIPINQELMKHENFDLYSVDIRDSKMIAEIIKKNKVKTIFHTAGLVPYLTSKDFIGVNVSGTQNLINIASQNGVSEFIYSSSLSVYSVPPSKLPVKEKHITNPSDLYGRSKLAGEKACLSVNHNMYVTVLRYAGIYGQGMNIGRTIPKFIKQALNNKPITIIGDGENSSDFVYIDDVVDANIMAWKDVACGIYNIGSGEETTIRSLATQIVKLTDSKSEIVLKDEKVDRPFRFYLDISKARKTFGYNPYTFSDGLKKYIEHIYKEAGTSWQ